MRTAAIALIVVCTTESNGQWHSLSTEFTGNYSSITWGVIERAGLRSGWNSIPNPSGTSSTEMHVLTAIAFPLGDVTETSTLGLGLEIPYVRNRYTGAGSQVIVRSGFDDLILAGKYSFTLEDESGLSQLLQLRSTRVAVLGKLKLPTAHAGQGSAESAMELSHASAGNGSVGFGLGFAFNTETGDACMIHGHALYWFSLPGNTYRMGNSAMYELSVLVPPLRLEAEPVCTVVPHVGVMGMNAASDARMNSTAQNTGADAYVAVVGIQSLWKYIDVVGSLWMFDLSYRFAIAQRVNGVQLGYGSSAVCTARLYVR